MGDADGLSAQGRRPAELVTNASNFIRGYDPRHRRGAAGGSAAARRSPRRRRSSPRRHHRRQRPRARAADLRDPPGAKGRHHAGGRGDVQRAGAVEQDRPRLVHADAAHLPAASSTCSPTRVCSTPTISRRGEEIYRQRVPHGRQRLQRLAGRGRRHASICPARTATSSSSGPARRSRSWRRQRMGEPLMATPAICRRRDVRAQARSACSRLARKDSSPRPDGPRHVARGTAHSAQARNRWHVARST